MRAPSLVILAWLLTGCAAPAPPVVTVETRFGSSSWLREWRRDGAVIRDRENRHLDAGLVEELRTRALRQPPVRSHELAATLVTQAALDQHRKALQRRNPGADLDLQRSRAGVARHYSQPRPAAFGDDEDDLQLHAVVTGSLGLPFTVAHKDQHWLTCDLRLAQLVGQLEDPEHAFCDGSSHYWEQTHFWPPQTW